MTEGSYDHVKIRTAKSWQGKEPIYVFQSTFSGIKIEGAKKFFLILDSRQESFGISLSIQKPESLALQGGMVNQIRKHCKGASIADILKDKNNGNLWLVLYSAGQEWFIRLAKSRPPEMSLVSPEASMLMRFGMKGTFTKPSPLPESLPSAHLEDFESIKSRLIYSFQESLAQELDEDHEDSGEIVEERSDLAKEQRVLLQKLRRKLKTYRKAYEKQQNRLPDTEEIQSLGLNAQMLQSFAYMVQEGDYQLDLPKVVSGQEKDLSIALDPELSVGANIESYFIRSKKAQKSREMGLKLIDQHKREIATLENDLISLDQAMPLAQVEALYDRYKIPKIQSSNTQAKVAAISKPYRRFLSSTGHEILVGKGPRENDELTKGARTNDYWIHTSQVAGSHIVVPAAKDIREKLPPQLLREAAILAIHYSKLRGDFAGEVYVARRADIKKQKGMPPGLWNVERCKTMFFRFEQEELKECLDRIEAQ